MTERGRERESEGEGSKGRVDFFFSTNNVTLHGHLDVFMHARILVEIHVCDL